MKRLKKAKFYDGIKRSDREYYEAFINPTSSEIDEVKKADPHNSVRGVIYNDNTMIIWPGSTGHYTINKYLTNKVDINQFRFCWDPGANEWIIDVDRTLTWDEAVECIKKYQSLLSQIGNINSLFYIMALNGKSGDCYIVSEV